MDSTIIAKRITTFEQEIQLFHWQTEKYSEHEALGDLYKYLSSFKDSLVEKTMGYTGKRPSKYSIILENKSVLSVLEEIDSFSKRLGDWAKSKRYGDIENMAQELSGACMKTKYLLTLK